MNGAPPGMLALLRGVRPLVLDSRERDPGE